LTARLFPEPLLTQDELKGKITDLTDRQIELKDELSHLVKTVKTINHDDIFQMFDKLGFDGHHDRPGYSMDQEIDRMIFECDSSMNNAITFPEVKECYYRSINDDTGLEPFELFNLIQFLMYDEDLGGSCSTDEVVALMVTRYGQKGADEHIKEMLENDDGDGELSYAEYLATVEKRPPLEYLRKKGEGLAASKCIHIDWQSEFGRQEAKRRLKVRTERLLVEANKRKKIKERKKAMIERMRPKKRTDKVKKKGK